MMYMSLDFAQFAPCFRLIVSGCPNTQTTFDGIRVNMLCMMKRCTLRGDLYI
eukprot:gnl/Chilomastix_caulleri/3235.p3 GENE.gnl/Chilomastix_caulleri/3235~~gnl/Chilomastix_caulleri/3235.p3  ORF type:complete len:52 (+),score=3.70 gnl/Chilomastix_caulleri/3235:325-480(+)